MSLVVKDQGIVAANIRLAAKIFAAPRRGEVREAEYLNRLASLALERWADELDPTGMASSVAEINLAAGDPTPTSRD